jgi:stage II sporulation protein D
LDVSTNTIVWEFDQPDGSGYASAKALQGGSAYSYIIGYKGTTKYTYDGVLEFSASQSDDVNGVKVINILSLETYVAGVIPYEISNTWPIETQKAFAIAVRSYAIYNLGRHKKSYNADVCCTSDCQVYKGFASTNARVRQAVTETKGKIAIYNLTGDPCIATYSSSTGGCTANAWDVWGSSPKVYGYLAAVATPWEKYEKYGKGSWTFTATGKQLYDRLEAKGYTALTGAVTKIEITDFGENSTYVNAIKFYDAAGHSVEVKQGNKVKSLLSSYVNSGNFVVAKAGQKVTRTNFTMLGFGATTDEEAEGVLVRTNPFDYLVEGRQSFHVLTANGAVNFRDSDNERVITANGVLSYNMSKALDPLYYPTVEGINGQELPDIMKLDPIVETETLTAEGPSGSFVFIGRGWGHGVGLSQYGTKDLGDMGYDYLTIFNAYYSDVSLVDLNEYLNGMN